MSNSFLVDCIGFLAQGLFSTRFIVQWLASEKARAVMAPTVFWKISLLASLFLVIYSVMVLDITLLVGQFIGYYIYIRNLMLKKSWAKWAFTVRSIVLILPILSVFIIITKAGFEWNDFSSRHENLVYFTWGFIGQIIFSSRFVFQWYYSEKQKESHLPLGFWVISIVGSIIIGSYALTFNYYPILLGHIIGIIMYSRNIMIHKKSKLA